MQIAPKFCTQHTTPKAEATARVTKQHVQIKSSKYQSPVTAARITAHTIHAQLGEQNENYQQHERDKQKKDRVVTEHRFCVYADKH